MDAGRLLFDGTHALANQVDECIGHGWQSAIASEGNAEFRGRRPRFPGQLEDGEPPLSNAIPDLTDMGDADCVGCFDNLVHHMARRDGDRRQDVVCGLIDGHAGVDILHRVDVFRRHVGMDERIGTYISRLQGALAQQRMAGSAYIDAVQSAERFDAQRRHVPQDPNVEDGKVDTVGHEHGEGCGPLALQELELNRRVGPDEVYDRGIDCDIGDEGAQSDLQSAPSAGAHELQPVRHGLGMGDQLFGHFEHVAACRRCSDVSPRTFEDAHPEFLFKGGDTSAERRLTDLQGGCRTPEMPVTGQDDGVLQQLQIDFHSRTVSSWRLFGIVAKTTLFTEGSGAWR